jgi:hypothetical protein
MPPQRATTEETNTRQGTRKQKSSPYAGRPRPWLRKSEKQGISRKGDNKAPGMT